MTAAGLLANPCFCAQTGTSFSFSDASASLAVAPFQVRIPIERIVSTAATIATGRLSGCRSARTSMNGIEISRISRIVGIPTVPSTTDDGHLKIRRR